MASDASRADLIARRNAAMATSSDDWAGADDLDPNSPFGHPYAIALSTRLTSHYCETQPQGCTDITPRRLPA